jgi:hypothetical protein
LNENDLNVVPLFKMALSSIYLLASTIYYIFYFGMDFDLVSGCILDRCNISSTYILPIPQTVYWSSKSYFIEIERLLQAYSK